MKAALETHDLLVALLLVRNALEKRSDAFFQPFGLTDAQFNILNLLAISKGPMDQLALTERLLVGKSSISIVLNRMVKAGLIQRREHPSDRRQVVLALTRRGRELWRKISPLYEKGVEEVFGSLPPNRRHPFLDDLEILYGALKRNTETVSGKTSFLTLRETLAHLSSAS
jgi:DNA-binding MarR family transcriptional regulator